MAPLRSLFHHVIFRFILNFFAAATRPGSGSARQLGQGAGDRSICHNTNVLLCETEREREREMAGRCRSITVYAFFSWAKEIIIFNPSGALTILGLLTLKLLAANLKEKLGQDVSVNTCT